MCDSTDKGCKLQFLFREAGCYGGTWTYIHEQTLSGGSHGPPAAHPTFQSVEQNVVHRFSRWLIHRMHTPEA